MLLEVCCDLVEGLAPRLWHPEECEDEEEEQQCRKDQEDVWPTKVLEKDVNNHKQHEGEADFCRKCYT